MAFGRGLVPVFLVLALAALVQPMDAYAASASEPKDYRKPLPRAPVQGASVPTEKAALASVVPPAAPGPTPTPVPATPSVSSSTSAPAPGPVSPGPRPTDHYVISANDVLLMKVYQEEDLESKPRVGVDGTVSLPLLGTVSVSGLTLEQAREKIRSELDRRFIVNPQVSLSVTEYAKRKFTVLGQVQRTGIYEYSGEEKMSLLKAIGMAGGYTRLAAPSRVTVQRIEKGSLKTIRVDAESTSRSPNGGPFEVLPDDTITVGARLF
ncbi:MAG: polysaccharide export protein [Verrucomicrobiales bacterium]|nr:polysaccharide export protein [Verrucomicrobiales bacterium]